MLEEFLTSVVNKLKAGEGKAECPPRTSGVENPGIIPSRCVGINPTPPRAWNDDFGETGALIEGYKQLLGNTTNATKFQLVKALQ
jgi:hypothetical protein